MRVAPGMQADMVFKDGSFEYLYVFNKLRSLFSNCYGESKPAIMQCNIHNYFIINIITESFSSVYH